MIIDKIIIASLNGILRVFNPTLQLRSNASTSDIGTDLLIEEDTKSPILQIALGQFIRLFLFLIKSYFRCAFFLTYMT